LRSSELHSENIDERIINPDQDEDDVGGNHPDLASLRARRNLSEYSISLQMGRWWMTFIRSIGMRDERRSLGDRRILFRK
jgi:hypothetical protein